MKKKSRREKGKKRNKARWAVATANERWMDRCTDRKYE
jgi:hypothetical protein